MKDRILGKKSIEPGMQVVFEPQTGCYHFENEVGDRFLFVSDDGCTDNKKYIGSRAVSSFRKIAVSIARQAQPRLDIEYVFRQNDKPGTIRYRFIKLIKPAPHKS
jgi:hypothetical protein